VQELLHSSGNRQPLAGGVRSYVRVGAYVFGISNMQLRNPLSQALGSSIRVNLLRVLVRDPARRLSGRELARLVGASPSQVNQHLEGLAAAGLLRSESIGRVHLWRPVEAHVLFPVLAEMFSRERSMLDSLKNEIRQSLRGQPVERAVLFGSIARGTERPPSDIDLLVVTRGDEDKEKVADALSRASTRFALRYGNPLSSLVLTAPEARRRRNPALWKAIEADGIPVQG
jgi:predicted nucleotidyltransferase